MAPSCPGSAPFRAKVTKIAAYTLLCTRSPLLSPCSFAGILGGSLYPDAGFLLKTMGNPGIADPSRPPAVLQRQDEPRGPGLAPSHLGPQPQPHFTSQQVLEAWWVLAHLTLCQPRPLCHVPRVPCSHGSRGLFCRCRFRLPSTPTHWCPSCLSSLTRPLCHLLRTPCSWSAGLK